MSTTDEILRGLPYFSDLPEDLLLAVCELSEQIEIGPETTLIEEGSSSEEMYVVIEGELVVSGSTSTGCEKPSASTSFVPCSCAL